MRERIEFCGFDPSAILYRYSQNHHTMWSLWHLGLDGLRISK